MDNLEELALQVSLEATTRGVSQEKEFLQISKNSQENTCVRDFFNKVADQ